jgi:hypothetical protein
MLFLSSCTRLAERDFAQYLDSRPAGPTMPYRNARYLLGSVPDRIPFAFQVSETGELLGTAVDEDHDSGTILLLEDQSAGDILAYYTGVLTDSALIHERERYKYEVFFPPEGGRASFCSLQDRAVFLEIFDLEDGLKDVRLHYTSDPDVIARTHCGLPVLAIEDYPFPYLAAPPNASAVGGGSGGGGKRAGYSGFSAETVVVTNDSLESVNDHYLKLLAAEGWILLDQSSTETSRESSWDFGYKETRSWLALLIVSTGDAPDQYRIELRSVSP